MILLYEDFETDEMDNFIDDNPRHQSLGYFHSYNGYMYATDGIKAIRCKTKLPEGIYKPQKIESIHSETHIDGANGETISKQFDWINEVGVKVKTVNLHDIDIRADHGFNRAILNIAGDVWVAFDQLARCMTCDGGSFTFHYTEYNKPIYIKEEVYEFVCMPIRKD